MNYNTTLLWEELKSSNKPIVMYGTGDGADKILSVMQRYGLTPVCFTASGDFAMKSSFRGYKVLPFEEVERRFGNFVILVCFGTDKPPVLERIYALSERYDVFAPDVPVTGEQIYTDEYIEEHSDKLTQVRDLFADEKSREVFDGWLEYRMGGRIDVLEQISSPREELLGLLKLTKNEFFVDAGAYRGDTVEEFLGAVSDGEPMEVNFRKIIAIEPDVANYNHLRRKFYAYGSGLFTAVNAAVWSGCQPLEFAVKTGRGGYADSKIDGRVRVKQVNGITIDSLFDNLDKSEKDYKPTFIKFDVEGAEAQAIKGAKTVITRHRPKMLISLYHRAEDMFELPLLLRSYARYKLYLRKTRCLPGWEFQLIAV